MFSKLLNTREQNSLCLTAHTAIECLGFCVVVLRDTADLVRSAQLRESPYDFRHRKCLVSSEL